MLPLLALSLLLAGCSGDEESPLDAAPTASAEPSEVAADPEAEVQDAWEEFWDALVESENQMNAEPGQFSGVADGPVAEAQLKRVRDQAAMNLRRTGAPEFRDIEVTAAGTSGRVVACVNQDPWGAEKDGEPLPETDFGFRPTASELEQVDGDWVVTSLTSPKDVAC